MCNNKDDKMPNSSYVLKLGRQINLKVNLYIA